jgi:uncharacterized protein YqjF (DUF2071 family)
MGRPERPFLTANWHNVAMLQYEVPSATLRPLVPRGTELDPWQGHTLVSVVGFQFLDTRVFGIPVPFHRDFEEVNLRFYVRRRVQEGWRRGVVFIREIVPRRMIAAVARRRYNEPYIALPMRHTVTKSDADPGTPRVVRYEWRQADRWQSLEVEPVDLPALPAADSQEEFLTEHYWGYTVQRDGGTLEYQVRHPQWRVWRAARASLNCDVARLYGDAFVPFLRERPVSALLAEGSRIAVFRGHLVPLSVEPPP